MRTACSYASQFVFGRLTWARPARWWQEDEHRLRLVALWVGRGLIFALLLRVCSGASPGLDQALLVGIGWLAATTIRLWRRRHAYLDVLRAGIGRVNEGLVAGSEFFALAIWFPLWLLVATYYPPSVWLVMAILSTGVQ